MAWHIIRTIRILGTKALNALFMAAVLAGAVQAQVQRSIVNPSFELAFTGTRAATLNGIFSRTDWIWVDAGEIPGWETTHPSVTNGCPAGNNNTTTAAYTCTPIELWFNSFLVTPAQGIVLAELNANTSSMLYQNVCLNNGETFNFNFAHRGRNGTDRARFQLTTSTTAPITVMDVSTGTAGTGVINAGGGATGTSATGIANGWTRYAGAYTYTGTSGIVPMGFIAVSTSGGNLATGNLLDDLNISLKPYVDFIAATSSAVEGTQSAPQLRVSGVIPSTGLTVTLTISGTAAFGSDFDYTGASTLTFVTGNSTTLIVRIPAGNYSNASGGNVFSLPFNIINDAVIENNETVSFGLPANSSALPYVVANPSTCGGTVIQTHTLTIIDNDIDLRATKVSAAASPLILGGTLAYTVTFANITPITPTIAPLTAHDVTATLSDAAPTGLSFSAWSCTASGSAACPAASGSGNISATAYLPQGGQLTYSVIAQVATSTSTCAQLLTNTASIGTATSATSGASMAEGSSVQGSASYVFGSNTATVSHTAQSCAALSITKASTPASGFTAGQTVTYTIVLTNAGPQSANNAIFKDTPSAGLNCTSVSCTAASGSASCTPYAGVTIAQLLGSGITLSSFPAASSLSFAVSCGVLATGL